MRSLWFIKRDGIKRFDHVLLALQLIRLGDVTHGAWSVLAQTLYVEYFPTYFVRCNSDDLCFRPLRYTRTYTRSKQADKLVNGFLTWTSTYTCTYETITPAPWSLKQLAGNSRTHAKQYEAPMDSNRCVSHLILYFFNLFWVQNLTGLQVYI